MRAWPLLILLTWLAACDAQPTLLVASRQPPGLPSRARPPAGWAWGLIRVGQAAPMRYGVAAPAIAPRGQVLVLPGYGEPAEAWFEAINALVDQGDEVWVLEGAGQGGWGRYAGPGDIGAAADFGVDVAALGAMQALMDHRPAVILAQSTAAPILLRALREGLPARGVILSAPRLAPDPNRPFADAVYALAPAMTAVRLGWLPAPSLPSWRRGQPIPAGRTGVIPAWRAANPDLRLGGDSWGWVAAFQAATDPAILASGITAPVLMLTPGSASDAQRLCAALPRCTLTQIAQGRGDLHLEADAAFDAWRDAALAFVRQTTVPPLAADAPPR